jgi:hypothetical protein
LFCHYLQHVVVLEGSLGAAVIDLVLLLVLNGALVRKKHGRCTKHVAEGIELEIQEGGGVDVGIAGNLPSEKCLSVWERLKFDEKNTKNLIKKK